MSRFALALALVMVPAAAPAGTDEVAAGEWQNVVGARLRLVSEAAPGPDGSLRGVLDIDLEPGWKTYWRDPGDSGVPPSVTVASAATVGDPEILYPAPMRFEDDYGGFLGYDGPVAFALVFPGNGGEVEAFVTDVFLGICETICIPVQARFRVEPGAAGEAAAVEAAFASLPGEYRSDFRAWTVSADDAAIEVEAILPEGGSDADLFVAGNESVAVGRPLRTHEGGAVRYTVPLSRFAPGDNWLPYTLVLPSGEAVSGMLALPD